MPELPILAYGFAGTFKLPELATCFAGARIREDRKRLVAEYDEERVAVAFDFGAVVFVNVSAEERARVLGSIITKLPTAEPHPPLASPRGRSCAGSAPARGRARVSWMGSSSSS